MLQAEQTLKALRESVLALSTDVAELARDQVGPEAADVVHALAAAVRRQTYHVVVCGEFKRGKSSLLNAIVGRRQLFPTGQELTTATVMTLSWGLEPRAVARRITSDGIVEEEIAIDDIATWVSACPGAQAWRIGQLDVQLPDERLAAGVILVDTPGIGGVDDVHSAITLSFLPRADALVLVLSAEQPATVSELAFVRKAMTNTSAVIFALAMADRCFDIQMRVEATRARLAAYLEQPPESFTILPVSATEAWHARDAHDEQRLAASGLPSLENAIWTTLIAQAGIRRLRAAVATLVRLAEDASAPIASELAAMAGPGELAKVLEEIDASEQAAIAVGGDLADRGRLEHDFTDRVEGVEQGFRERLEQVLADVRQAVADGADPITPEALAAMAHTAASAAARAMTALGDSANAVAADWERRTAQPLRVLSLRVPGGPSLPAPPLSVRQTVELRDALTDGAKAVNSLGWLGAIIASLAGPGAATGVLAYPVVVFLAGVLDHMRRANVKARARLLRSYADQLVAGLQDYRSDTVARIEDTQQELLQHLKMQIRTLNRAQLSTIARARLRVQESARADTEHRAARAAELERQREIIIGYASRLAAIDQDLLAVEATVNDRSHHATGTGADE